jgi:FtsZ-binding cell division protein ZapB
MPDTLLKNLRTEIDSLKRYCTSQIALMQKELKDEQSACIRRHQEIRELITKLESANLDFKRQSAAHSAKVTSLIKQLMRKKDPCNE